MPVINLPKDTRWGDLGAGLGNIAAGALNAYNTQQTAAGVAEVLQDPNVSESNKPSVILKKFGDVGYNLYKQTLQTQQLQAQIKETLAGAGLNSVKSALVQAQLGAGLPEAEVARTKAATTQSLSAADENVAQAARIRALAPGEVQAQSDVSDLRGAQSSQARAGAAENFADAAMKEFKLRQMQSYQSGAGPDVNSLDTLAQSLGVPASDPAIVGMKQIYQGALARGEDPNKAIEAPLKAMSERLARQQQTKAMPPEELKRAGDQAATAAATRQFMEAFLPDPTKTGLTSGSGIKARLERYGIGTGDAALIQMLESQVSQTALNVKANGAMMLSGATIKLGKDISQSVDRSELANLIQPRLIADQQIQRLSTEIAGHEGTSVNVKPKEMALATWKEIQHAVTPATQVFNEGTPKERTAMYLPQSNIGKVPLRQIDPTSLKTLVTDNNKQYEYAKGKTAPGKWVFEAARQANNIDPWTWLNKTRIRNGLKTLPGYMMERN